MQHAFTRVIYFSMALCAASWAETVSIAIAGDSTVANYKAGEPIAGWGQMLGYFLVDGVAVENRAIGGRSTKTFLSEGRWERLLAGKPRFALVQFGHNDGHAKGQPESTEAAGDFKEYLRTYADTAKAAGVTLIFITPVHRRTFAGTEPTAELAAYAAAMKEVAREKAVFCVDLHGATGDLLKELGEKGAEGLYCKPDDRSHFSPAGAYRVAGLLAKALKTAESPMKAFIRDTPMPHPVTVAKTTPSIATACASVHIFGVFSKIAIQYEGGSDGVSGGPATWMKENADHRLVVGTPPVTPEWTRCYFTFTPKASGTVVLIVMGSDKDRQVCYDDFEVTGAALENGGFEEAGADGHPKGWSFMAKPGYETGSPKAHGGSAFVKCGANDRYSRNVNVVAGEKVTVSFWMKAVEP